MQRIALYIHWPFCKSKCPYCDFNSHVRDNIEAERWKQAYIKELNSFLPYIRGRKVESVFFGGGTPSLMLPAIVDVVLTKLAEICDVPTDVEVTLEANPTSVEAEKFRQFRQSGINRLSLGIQSLNDADLKFLGREHNVSEALRAIALAQETFDRYSFDLIYARPGQTLAMWEKELRQALTLAGKHLSLYQLTIEKGTPFFSDYRKAKFAMPDEKLSAALYQQTEDIMNAAGMPAYEVSNYAAPGEECRHNLVYWRYGEYLGIGPGAHSRLVMDGRRNALMMTHHPENWLQQVETHGQGIQSKEILTENEIAEEFLLMGLRLTQGIDRRNFEEIIGKPFEEALKKEMLESLIHEGLITLKDNLSATYNGRLVLNALVGRLVEAL